MLQGNPRNFSQIFSNHSEYKKHLSHVFNAKPQIDNRQPSSVQYKHLQRKRDFKKMLYDREEQRRENVLLVGKILKVRQRPSLEPGATGYWRTDPVYRGSHSPQPGRMRPLLYRSSMSARGRSTHGESRSASRASRRSSSAKKVGLKNAITIQANEPIESAAMANDPNTIHVVRRVDPSP